MNNPKYIEEIWWFIYNNLLIGKISMVVSLFFLALAVYVFIRWKLFALSMLLLSSSVAIAYLNGIMKIFGGN